MLLFSENCFIVPRYGEIPQKKNVLQLVQNFAGRIVFGLRKYDHISEEFKSLRWLPIADKLLLNVSVMVHKCLNGRAPDYLSQTFTRRQAHHDRKTRYKKDLNLPSCRLKTGQRSFAFWGASSWNKLPKDMKEGADCRIFKKRLITEPPRARASVELHT